LTGAIFMKGYTRFITLMLLGAVAMPSHALRFNVRAGAPFVFVQVGASTAAVDEVVFNVAGTTAGNGTPIVGAPVVPITVLGYSGTRRTAYSVTMNSATGLVNAAGVTIPFSDFSWTTRDGDLPAGRFDDSASQILQQVSRRGRPARGITDYLTFSYANTAVYPGGTYTGRVVYTITQL
jgi:hypothetical protein